MYDTPYLYQNSPLKNIYIYIFFFYQNQNISDDETMTTSYVLYYTI